MGLNPQTTMGVRRRQAGYSAMQLAAILKTTIPNMSESRLFRIESGRAAATPYEREKICQLLNCKSFEIQI